MSKYRGSKSRRGLNSWDPKSIRPGTGALGEVNDKWTPETPRTALPRGVKAGLLAGSVGLYGERLIGMTAWGSQEMVWGQLANAQTGSLAINLTNGGIGFRRFLRSSPASNTQDHSRWGLMSIHGYLDPAGPQLGQALIAQDLCYTSTTGTATYYFGWWNFNTSADPTSFVGVGWVGDPATGTWWAKVSDGTATPSNALHSYDSGVAITAHSRLAIVLDGNDHTAGFYMNGVLVSTYAPSTVPAQFGAAGVYFGYGMITAGGGTSTGTMGLFGGGNPRLLSLVEV